MNGTSIPSIWNDIKRSVSMNVSYIVMRLIVIVFFFNYTGVHEKYSLSKFVIVNL